VAKKLGEQFPQRIWTFTDSLAVDRGSEACPPRYLRIEQGGDVCWLLLLEVSLTTSLLLLMRSMG
jgi:hypothetical protein